MTCDICNATESRAGKPFTQQGLIDHKRSKHGLESDGTEFISRFNQLRFENPLDLEELADTIIGDDESDGVYHAMQWELL